MGVSYRLNGILRDARVAAKVPPNSGLAGQLLGRTAATLLGSEGMSAEDPLVRLETVRRCVATWGSWRE